MVRKAICGPGSWRWRATSVEFVKDEENEMTLFFPAKNAGIAARRLMEFLLVVFGKG